MHRVGDFVWFYFDTGAMGVQPCYGKVIKAGQKTFTVRWMSGLCNRLRQDNRDIKPITDLEMMADARKYFS